MADEKRTVVIDVEVEGDAEQELAEVNKELVENRKNIRELSKDYNQNADQIAKLEIRNKELSASKRDLIKQSQTESNSLNALRLKLAEQTKERNNLNTATEEGAIRFEELQASIRGLNDEISGFEQAGGDFRRNVGNYPELIDAADEATGGFIGTLSSFVNPITAVGAALGGLGAAYVSTGRGSRDLARAQDRLADSFGTVGNALADLVGGDGEGGILETLAASAQSFFFGTTAAIRSGIVADLQQSLREFELVQLESDRLAKTELDNAEKLRQIRDEERNSLEDRIKANEELEETINRREQQQTETQRERLRILEALLEKDAENLELQKEIAQAQFELADIAEEAQGFRSEQEANDLALRREGAQQRSQLRQLELEEQLVNVQEGSRREFEIRKQIIEETLAIELEAVGNNVLARQILEQEARNNLLTLESEFVDERLALLDKDAQEREKARQQELREEEKLAREKQRLKDQADRENLRTDRELARAKQSIQADALSVTEQLATEGLNAQTALSLAQIGIDQAEAIAALTAASEGNPANAFTFGGAGIAQFLLGLARIGTNIALAKSSIPNGTGSGISTPSSSISSGAGLANVNASLLSQFSEPSTTAANQAQATGEAVAANQPPIFVSVTDINDAQNANQVKVTETTLG